MRKKVYIKAILTVLAFIPVIIILFPIIWALPSAFKGIEEIWKLPSAWLPTQFTFGNFPKIFEFDYNGGTFLKSMLFTTFVAVLATLLGLFVNINAAYALAQENFKFKKAIWIYIIAAMFVPGITIQLTSIKVVSDLKMIDTIFVLIIPGLAQSYTIFFLRQFFLNIPRAYKEAAEIDGCNNFVICWKIYVPNILTPIIIIAMGMFMGNWNSYIWPTLTIIENTDSMTLIMQMMKTIGNYYSENYGVVIAASMIVMIIPLTLYAVLQKYIMEGATLTGLK